MRMQFAEIQAQEVRCAAFAAVSALVVATQSNEKFYKVPLERAGDC